jgi:hypothetical protein
MLKSCIREYNRQGFSHPLKEIVFQKTPIEEAKDCLGLMIFDKDLIKVRAPSGLSLLQACSFGAVVSHEYAHHLIQEHCEPNPDSYKLGNNLVHYACNDLTKQYTYQKRYWSPSFFARYGLPYIKITYFDLRRLMAEKAYIQNLIFTGRAIKGKDVYW